MSFASDGGAGHTWILTSISPRQLPAQADAIRTWVKTGLPIGSINHKSEIDVLRQAPELIDLPIRFISTENVATKYFDRPLVYLDSYFQFAEHKEIDQFILINSDNRIADCDYLISTLSRDNYSVAISNRSDEDPETGSVTPYEFGYDLFIIRKESYKCLSQSVFCLGVPYIDYFIPIISYLAGFDIAKTKTPLTLHIDHEKNWNFELYAKADYFFHKRLIKSMETAPKDRLQMFATHFAANTVNQRPAIIERVVAVIDSFNKAAAGTATEKPDTAGVLDILFMHSPALIGAISVVARPI